MNTALAVVLAIVIAPLVGCFLKGVDRKVTARLQGRRGPPIEQPFYDLIKLLSKERIFVTRQQTVFVFLYLILVIISLVLLFLGLDLLMLLFILGFGGVCLVLGALSIKSPYSQFGGHRELLQLLSFEPILLLFAVAVYLKIGSFRVADIFSYEHSLLPYLWPSFIGLLFALTIMMRKSPFDISTAEHAHQELVRGAYTEFSGPILGVVELTHWYELILALCLIGLLWFQPGWVWLGLIIAICSFFAEILVDNSTARLTWSWMIRLALGVGLGFTLANIIFLIILG